MTPEEKRRAAELLREYERSYVFGVWPDERQQAELRDLAAKLEAEAGE
jgi:hypothetical protein